jgi:hypothetical protein
MPCSFFTPCYQIYLSGSVMLARTANITVCPPFPIVCLDFSFPSGSKETQFVIGIVGASSKTEHRLLRESKYWSEICELIPG